MFYIYVKTHNKTGLKYLGYTKKDPIKYMGSGMYWLRHLEIYGNDITTEIVKECETKQEVKDVGIYYSKLWNVIKSKEWANLKAEEGNGGDMSSSDKWQQGRKSKNFAEKQAERAKGNTNVRGKKWWYDLSTGEKIRSKDSPGYSWVNKCPSALTEEGRKKIQAGASKPKSVRHKEQLSIAAKKRPCNVKGTIWVVNKEGNRKRINPNHVPEGYISVKESK